MKSSVLLSRWGRYVGTAVLTIGVVGASFAGATFSHIGDLPGGSINSRALGVSGDGRTVVGFGTTELGSVAFVYRDGFMQSLGIPAGKNGTVANAVSFDGSVVVGSMSSASGSEAFRYVNGVMSGIGDLPGGQFRSFGNAVSSDGNVIIGTGWGFTGPLAFRWTGGVMSSLGDLPGGGIFSNGNYCSPDGTAAVGLGFSNNGPEACAWQGTPRGIGDLAGGTFNSVAYGCSANGSIIVGVGTSANGSEAFKYQNNTMVGLGDLPGGTYSSTANAVSGNGRIIVGSASTAAGPVAFVWDSENGMRNLNTVLTNVHGINMNGWVVREATSVSDDGSVIVGTVTSPGGHLEAYMARVPTPGSVEASVSLEAFIGNWSSVPLTLEILDRGTNNVREALIVNIDENGQIVINTGLRGEFDLRLDGTSFLADRINKVYIGSNGATNLGFDLRNGDVDGDDEVNLVDYSLVRLALGSVEGDSNWNASADLNGDEEVNLADFAIVAANFGRAGD